MGKLCYQMLEPNSPIYLKQTEKLFWLFLYQGWKEAIFAFIICWKLTDFHKKMIQPFSQIFRIFYNPKERLFILIEHEMIHLKCLY